MVISGSAFLKSKATAANFLVAPPHDTRVRPRWFGFYNHVGNPYHIAELEMYAAKAVSGPIAALFD